MDTNKQQEAEELLLEAFSVLKRTLRKIPNTKVYESLRQSITVRISMIDNYFKKA